MRRLFVLALLMILAVVPAAAFAQDATPEATYQPVWDLTQTATVNDLGIQFSYPDGWVGDTSNGIRLAENQDDLNTLLDTDPATNPQGYDIFLSSVPLSALNLDATAKLDAVADALVKVSGVTETANRVDEAILSRRSITIIGTDKDGRAGVATVWLQDGYVVALTLGGPKVDRDVEYTWGMLLGSVVATKADALDDTPVASPNGDFTMNYPKGWFTSVNSQSTIIAADNDDLTAMTSGGAPKKGIAVVILEAKLANLGTGVTDLATLGDSLHKSAKWDDTVIPAEFIVAGQPALSYSGPVPDGAGAYEIYTAFLKDADNAVLIGVFAPTQDGLTQFMPDYLTMLGTVKAAAPAS